MIRLQGFPHLSLLLDSLPLPVFFLFALLALFFIYRALFSVLGKSQMENPHLDKEIKLNKNH